MYRGVLAAAAAIFACAPASAASHTYTYSGYVTSGAPAGARFSGTFTWDDAATYFDERCDAPDKCARYFNALTDFTYFVSSGSFGGYSGDGAFTTVWSNFHNRDLFGFQSTGLDPATFSGSLTGFQFSLGTAAPVGLFGFPPALPTRLDLDDFASDFRVWQVTAGGTTFDGVVDILFEGVVPRVPEPATWAMMIVGFGLAGAATRRRSGARSALGVQHVS